MLRITILFISICICSCAATGKSLNDEGIALANQGRYEEALDKFSQAQKKDPDRFENYLNVAQIYIVTKQPEKALPEIEKAQKLKPDMVEIQLMKIQLKFLLGDVKEAESLLSELEKDEKNYPQLYLVYIAIGDNAFHLKNWRKSAEWYTKATKIQPGKPDAFVFLGRSLLLQALGNLQHAHLSQQNPFYSAFNLNLDFATINLQPAKAAFKKAVYLDKDNVEAHLMLGTIAMQTKQYQDAQLEIGEVLRIDKQNLIALMAMSINENYLQNSANSKKYLDMATKMHPDKQEPLFLKAFLLIEQKKYEDSLRLYTELVEKFPQASEDVVQSFRLNFAYYFDWLVPFVAHQDQKIASFTQNILQQVTQQNFDQNESAWRDWWSKNGERK